MTNVAIVILNWNGWEDTLSCLQSLTRLTLSQIKLSVIVVDNASTNDSSKKLSVFTSKKFDYKFVQNSENLGFAGGNNIGIQVALDQGAEYICILNNDTVMEEQSVLKAIWFMKANPRIGILSPKIYFYKGFEFHKDRYKKTELGNVIWYAGGKIDWDNVYGSNAHVDEVDGGQRTEGSETEFATGACMFVRAEVFRSVGLFDEKYFLYLEDTDLSMRTKKAGYLIYYLPESIIWHKVSQSSGIGSHLNDYFTTRNRLLFGMRYASLRARFALFRESVRFLVNSRKWQKQAVIDYYMGRLGKGSWK